MKQARIFNAEPPRRKEAEKEKLFASRPLCFSALNRVAIALAVGVVPGAARACSVCFGNSDSNLTQGMLAGVLVLLLVVLSVLGGFVALFIYLARRAAATALEDQSTEPKLNQ
jgi:hypothetical protein